MNDLIGLLIGLVVCSLPLLAWAWHIHVTRRAERLWWEQVARMTAGFNSVAVGLGGLVDPMQKVADAFQAFGTALVKGEDNDS
jgi:hypothetical protein